MIRCVIIDDEPHCIGALEILLQKHAPNVIVLATCRNGHEGLDAIKKHIPNLVFLDIAMPKMSGFEMLKRLEKIDFQIIFTTAYDQYALEAFQVNAIDYLLKPIAKNDLMISLRKTAQFIKGSHDKEAFIRHEHFLQFIEANKTSNGRLAVPTLEGLELIKIETIKYIQSEGNYSRIICTHEKRILVTKKLKQLEATLLTHSFIRIHRQILVNLDFVQKYVRGDGGYIVLDSGEQLSVSRRRKDELLKLIR